eukprot:CAMPEP_0185700976 /NCGR_PEP_ID=MMETSP1164-20130828/8236_1 /TAXON_ID=1104430 /ORGANISM="Chrysoreinhardia sp, Strain CCMP2950" /LENGTH=77 /DNA_ID=CAMNT_0028367947 /DNA_START=28 /DNA_END=258 /DNA_ORIENTATION=-
MSSGGRGARSVALTAELSQWDDILISKDVATREQCLIAKGFTKAQVVELLKEEATDRAVAAVLEEQRWAEQCVRNVV